ncbi:MAG: tetratricopeptide repeat protein [Chloroflexota bacterium]
MANMLKLVLFGTAQVYLNDIPLTKFSSKKTQALLFYLAVTGRLHTRDTIANLLWSHMTEAQARKNLRDALSNLRKYVGDYLIINRQSIAFNQKQSYWLDVQIVRDVVNIDDPNPSKVDIERLCESVDLYQDDFLAGFHIRGEALFEEWLLAERASLKSVILQSLQMIIQFYAEIADSETALHYVNRALQIDPWHEYHHQQKMTHLAQLGQLQAARHHYESYRQWLQEELDVEPAIEISSLYENIVSTEMGIPHNLPGEATVFIGRTQELDDIQQRLNDPGCRLLTLMGPGGIGKTRLALHVATQLIAPQIHIATPRFRHGVFFVSLTAAHSFDHVITMISMALDITTTTDREIEAQILSYLGRAKPYCLLILDNFEHLISHMNSDQGRCLSFLESILQASPHIKLLITSRERLKLSREWALNVQGLTYPKMPFPVLGDVDIAQNQILSTYSAPSLFIQHAQQLLPHKTFTSTDIQSIFRICQLVEGMPLGITLAAGWIRAMSCAEIVDEIEKDTDFLTSSLADMPPRHRSLRAIFDYAWRLLSKENQHIFAQLSIFQNGFHRQAGEQICRASASNLIQLIDKSLINYAQDNRYYSHELLRQYAAEKLQDLTIHNQPSLSFKVRNRHSVYYLKYVQDRNRDLNGQDPQLAVQEIRQELDNVRQAWQWAFVTLKVDLLASSSMALMAFYDLAGLFQEGSQTFTQAVAYVRNYSQFIDKAPEEIKGALCWLLVGQMKMAGNLGDYQTVASVAQEAKGLTQGIQHSYLESLIWLQNGIASNHLGAYEDSLYHLNKSLHLSQMAECASLEADIRRELGATTVNQGKYDLANEHYQQALRHFQSVGNRRKAGLVLGSLGVLAEEQDDPLQAGMYYEQALPIFREIDDRWAENAALNNLGVITLAQGYYSKATALFNQALDLCRDIGHRLSESIALFNLGAVYHLQGAYNQAEAYYQQSLQISTEIGDQFGDCLIYDALGDLQYRLNKIEKSLELCQKAANLGHKIGAPAPEADALTHLGQAHLALGKINASIDAFSQALNLQQQLGKDGRGLDAQAGLVRVYLKQGNTREAQQYVEAILAQIEIGRLEQIKDPFQIYLSCYQYLKAVKDVRAATILRQAYGLLMKRAKNIDDSHLHHSYLENVDTHREIVRCYNRAKLDVSPQTSTLASSGKYDSTTESGGIEVS